MPIVLVGSEAAGLAIVSVLVLAAAPPLPDSDAIMFAGLSGVFGIAGLGAFYRGMAIGAIGVVAPISATAAAIPVAFGIAAGERPSAAQLAGMAIAVLGVALASREPADDAAGARLASGTGLALVAAVGFGGFFVLMDRAVDGGEVLWPILVNRGLSLVLVGLVALLLRPAVSLRKADVGALCAIGVFDILANTLYAAATTRGLISVVAVLSSLYPVVAVGLAMAVLRERVAVIQRVGALAAIAGAAMLASG